MAITKNDIKARFKGYLQQGEDFYLRAKRHFEELFRKQLLGTDVFVWEYATGLYEPFKIYYTTADFLDEMRSFEAKRKEEHQRELEKLWSMEQEVEAAKLRAGIMEAIDEKLSKKVSLQRSPMTLVLVYFSFLGCRIWWRELELRYRLLGVDSLIY